MNEDGSADALGKANWIANAKQIERAEPIKKYRGRLAGETVAVVGAGPSLDSAYEHLLAWRKKGGTIVAVDRAAKTLALRGILPQYVVTQDNGALPREFFYEPLGAKLLFHQCASAAFVSRWTGPTITASLPGGRTGLGMFDFGTHVGFGAAHFSIYAGARRVVLVGVDLARLPDRTHAEGAVDPLLHEEIEVESVTGDMVWTDRAFEAGILEFGNLIDAELAEIYQTSTFGARLRGAHEVPVGLALSVLGDR